MRGGVAARWLIVAAACAVLMTPSAFAAQGTIDLRSELPITLEGQHSAATQSGTFLLEGDAGTASFLLEGDAGTLERVVHRAYGYVKGDDPQAGLLMEQRVERHTLPLEDAYISLDQRLDSFTLMASKAPTTLVPGAARDPLHVGALDEAKHIVVEAEPPLHLTVGQADSVPFEHTLRAGLYQARAMDGRATIEGAFDLLISDAVVSYTGGEESTSLLAHFRTEERPGGLYDPVKRQWFGVGTHTEYIHEYLRLRVDDGRMQVQYLGVPATLYADTPHLETLGSATFPAASGTITMHDDAGDAVHTLDGEELRIAGRFGFDLTRMDGAHTLTDVDGSGDLTQVTYAAQTHRYDWTAIAAATGIGAVLVAVGAWLALNGKTVIASIGGGAVAGYARVHGDDVLEHSGRLEVYERVKADPGMHFMDLCNKVPFGASTLNYHLRVLERNGFISRVKDGRYVRFFDAKTGEYSRDRKVAASTLRNHTTAAIAGFILHNPGIAQRDLAANFGIAASTVSWHVQRLQRDGLVEKQRDHHFTRYYMGEAWSTLPPEELHRVGYVA